MKPTYVVSLVLVVVAIAMAALFITNTGKENSSTDSASDASMQVDEATGPDTAPTATSEESTNLAETYPNLEGANINKAVDAQNKAEVTINIDDFLYQETVVTISKGTKVTWVNNGGARHDVTTAEDSELKGINSELLATNESFSHTFSEAGQFDYYCSPHPTQMRGVIIVK